jgi:RNA polymerase sigma-70 factor, ECF subfamily
MPRDEKPLSGEPPNGLLMEADAHLLAQVRDGDVEAGNRFAHDYYPAVYRYLLYLTGHRETAEDLTQETFLLAWRHLDQFQGRAPVQLWLHTIARREFLRARRRQRAATSLEEAAQLPEVRAALWTEEAELRVLLSKLPEEQQEVMLLSYLGGYSSSEIAQIIQAPARTVRYLLAKARTHLSQALGQGDLTYLNEPAAPMRQWAWLPLDQMHALETRLVWRVAADPVAPGQGAGREEAMERREFLRHAAVGAAGLMLPESEKEIVDHRLTHKATLAFKGTALSDLCEHLRSETGVHLNAGPSVADEKVTLFCEQTPLREVMRQLSRPFGYTWIRSSKAGAYRYELVQDLRSQLLEEELRNRDRNAALLALEKEIERFRPYLGLSPDQALARSKTAPPAESKLLEQLAWYGWGPAQMYFRLSPNDLSALRAGQKLTFSAEPRPGERPLPPDVAGGVLQSMRDWRLFKRDGAFRVAFASPDARKFGVLDAQDFPDGRLPAEFPKARATVTLWISHSDLGQFTFGGTSGLFIAGPRRDLQMNLTNSPDGVAAGMSPIALAPNNRVVNAKLARDPALGVRVTVRPRPSCRCAPPPVDPRWAASGASAESAPEPRATTADVLEALHQATGLPIVADYYTRLYPPEAVSVQNIALFDALNELAGATRLRWTKDGSWLQFRSVTFYYDGLKEVPNRFLKRWAASRREHGALTLDDVIEIAHLPDTQLDAEEMAEGAEECFGLAEWELASNSPWRVRPHLRFLASFSPEQRVKAMSATGLPFGEMSLPQQQQYLALAFDADDEPLRSMEDLAGAALRVDYSQPGWFEWRPSGPSWSMFMRTVPVGSGKRMLRPPVRERTRETALESARRLDPHIREAMLEEARRLNPAFDEAQLEPQASQIVPTTLDLAVIYMTSVSLTGKLVVAAASQDPPRRARGSSRERSAKNDTAAP